MPGTKWALTAILVVTIGLHAYAVQSPDPHIENFLSRAGLKYAITGAATSETGENSPFLSNNRLPALFIYDGGPPSHC